uniref:DNA-(Apurinic or apyrimidinic site) lyase n=1 Tax=Opuntia streptacantha TaxID=393608 RepID=A0A7C9D9H8_OPUST
MEESNKHSVSLDDDVQDESLTVPGTLLIPSRTAMRGFFPLNGTYFQVNEVFADDESSQRPIDVPRIWLWNLPRRTLYCGSGITSIFRGLTWREIHRCCCEGFVCTRGFNRKTRAPKKIAQSPTCKDDQAPRR